MSNDSEDTISSSNSFNFINGLGLLISVIGLVVALIALFIAKQANEISNLSARKATDPYLIYEIISIPNTDLNHELELRIHNVGLGPAVILNFEGYKNDILVSGMTPLNGHDLAASFGLSSQATSRDELRFGKVIPSNERVTIFKVTKWHNPISIEKFQELVRNGTFNHKLIICYRSIYPDRYFSAVGSQEKIPKASCAEPGYFKKFSKFTDPMRRELDVAD